MELIFNLRNLSQLISLLLSLTINFGLNAYELKPYEAQYVTSIYGVTATGKRTLKKISHNKYILDMEVNFLWFGVSESTEFIINDNNVKTLKYSYKVSGSGNKKNINMIFDKKNSILRKDINGKKTKHMIKGRLYDKLSYQIQMRLDLLKDQNVSTLKYIVADHNNISEYEFLKKNKNEDNSEASIIFERIKNNKFTRIWFSSKKDFFPEKFYLKKGKEEQTITLEDFKFIHN